MLKKDIPTTDKKTPIFAKNPIIGGIPAIENTVTTIDNAKPELDFFNKTKSLNSLLYLFFKFFFLIFNNKYIYQIHKPEIT